MIEPKATRFNPVWTPTVLDRCDALRGHCEINARDCQQPVDRPVISGAFGDLPIQHLEINA